tara:strand:- start:3036 stop:3239 length:204 start_codon:yes stop_codon:yes gene_type:complete
MSYYKNHKRKAIKILYNLSKHIKESTFDYDLIDLDRALEEAKTHYKHYLDMKLDDKYKPQFENKYYK